MIHINGKTPKQIAAMHEYRVPCPFCGRNFRFGGDGWYCPDPVHCGHWTWVLPDQAAPMGAVA